MGSTMPGQLGGGQCWGGRRRKALTTALSHVKFPAPLNSWKATHRSESQKRTCTSRVAGMQQEANVY